MPPLRAAGTLQTGQELDHIGYIRATVPWRPVLTDGNGARLNPRPTASGVHSAVVVGADGQTQASGAEEIHTDKLGRIKVLRFGYGRPLRGLNGRCAAISLRRNKPSACCPWQQAQDSQRRNTCWRRVDNLPLGLATRRSLLMDY